MPELNLLGSTTRVETPFIKATIGEFTFGVYDKRKALIENASGVYTLHKIMYPNYIQSLTVQKINGTVNNYTLSLLYPITESDDPNFFEKVFSSVHDTRKITLSYGDLSVPNYLYREEEAIITDIKSQFSINSSSISYTVEAVSSAVMLNAGKYSFPGKTAKPSDLIKVLLRDSTFGLLDIFYGMKDKNLVSRYNLIPGDDVVVQLETKYCSPLDYLLYLTSCMRNTIDSYSDLLKSQTYVLTVVDDISGIFGGPYFKIVAVDKTSMVTTATDIYNIDIGYPSQNIVTAFSLSENNNYSIYYDYAYSITGETSAPRINDEGEIEFIYAPALSSSSSKYRTTEEEKTWWTNVVQFPVSSVITFKGLLRPAILMTHIKLNVYFYGRKHISSGIYIVTKQVDQIDTTGFRTTLSLTRIKGDSDIV